MDVRALQMQDFTYDLPDNRIAKYPLPERDLSKLLIYKSGLIKSDIYRNLAVHLPENSLLVFNNTLVIPARMLFKNAHGAEVEVFCLEPAEQHTELNEALLQTRTVQWRCLIGKASKWKEKFLHLENEALKLSAQIVGRNKEAFIVEFSWTPQNLSFREVLDKTGTIPIPPYLHRASEEQDTIRYQTIYASMQGSVAAPTAGLHFTNQIFESLKAKNISTLQVSLHVGAGTFKPVKSQTIGEHDMHTEWMDVSIDVMLQLLHTKSESSSPIVAVGTTSLRTLESLYWMGVKAKQNPQIEAAQIQINQWEPYDAEISYSAAEALEALITWMAKNNLLRMLTKTGILIAPGYKLRIADGLITNFHQPGSTLLLLVAALVGNDWKAIYNYAMVNDFRFLSYGDGSLLWAR
jgi:S-adenosylmethionine:tRNA ribosyltransferase-isomerase